MIETFDVLIVGAGPAGSVAALLLAREGLSVALCDVTRHPNFCVGETLPQQASQLLRQLDLWNAFAAQGHAPAPGMMSVWGSCDVWTTDFIFSPFGNGWHLNRAKFNQMLADAAARAGAVFFRDSRITACTGGERGWRVCAAGLERVYDISCRFLVDAAGRTGAGRLGFAKRMISDRLIAAAGLCTPESSAPESSYTLVEAVDEGWFYSALLPSRKYLVAYMTDADLYSKGRCRTDRFLESQLEKAPHTNQRIGSAPSERWLVPAFSSVRERAADRHWLAVGDAARSYDPLSGLGVCTSMNMAIQAVPPILQFLRGDSSGIAEYDRVNRKAYAEYEEARRTQYSLEQRWPESDFWRRRQAQANDWKATNPYP